MSDSRATNASKVLSVFYGCLAFGFVLIAQELGGLLQAGLSILGMTGGPLLGVFTLGMLFPWSNSEGATLGLIASQSFMLWLGIGTHFAKLGGHIVFLPLPFRADGCPPNVTLTIPEAKVGTE